MAGQNLEDFIFFEAEMMVMKPALLFSENTEMGTLALHTRLAQKLGMEIVTGIDNPILLKCPRAEATSSQLHL